MADNTSHLTQSQAYTRWHISLLNDLKKKMNEYLGVFNNQQISPFAVIIT